MYREFSEHIKKVQAEIFCFKFLKNVQYAISVKYSDAWSCCMKYQREEQYFNSDFQNGETEMVILCSEWIRCLVKWWFRKKWRSFIVKGTLSLH